MTGRIGTKGQVVIPKALRDRARLHPGDEVDFELPDEEIVLVARRVPLGSVAGSGTLGWPRVCLRIVRASLGERLPRLMGDSCLA
jgi:AbrB family looped-hinge helix DNA binding protein